ncbi:MAG: hypothetical protein IJM84_03035, partial [Bacteroidaceae bacterium]|nr:hypothetical protein [Bacteroidaceae bacterium]
SDGRPNWQSGYEGHEFVYCMLNNFGARNGVHGRLDSTITGYYNALAQYPQTCKGVGATPEGIETNPVLYEALFELPWTKVQSPSDWTDEMVLSRYGMTNDTLREVWQLLRKRTARLQDKPARTIGSHTLRPPGAGGEVSLHVGHR